MTDNQTDNQTIAEPSEQQLRLDALDRAIGYHIGRDGDPDKVVETATLFESYLRGV
jgi:hypothetical protein